MFRTCNAATSLGDVTWSCFESRFDGTLLCRLIRRQLGRLDSACLLPSRWIYDYILILPVRYLWDQAQCPNADSRTAVAPRCYSRKRILAGNSSLIQINHTSLRQTQSS